MNQFLKLFGISAVIFLMFDLFWLLVVSKNLYQTFIGELLGDVKVTPAIIFYFVYLVGVVFFVLIPGIDKQSIFYTISSGALFGFICYSTYDLTNLATIKNWSVTMTIIDLVWGTSVTAITSAIVYFINFNFLKG
ncbi:DUF2177 family protein [Vagococcus sp. CY52-2]|uniref:DUF2177 family protein n=1 Tax=Vagococcus sp. CY52-2 TaxID=2925838 RepID=UPI001F58C689|nr:DUF2177 family protein [Vagococcus sp. CY52-2]UNM89095.1 DUF2177 family protein [Vagococcus sp. CY52-2]